MFTSSLKLSMGIPVPSMPEFGCLDVHSIERIKQKLNVLVFKCLFVEFRFLNCNFGLVHI